MFVFKIIRYAVPLVQSRTGEDVTEIGTFTGSSLIADICSTGNVCHDFPGSRKLMDSAVSVISMGCFAAIIPLTNIKIAGRKKRLMAPKRKNAKS